MEESSFIFPRGLHTSKQSTTFGIKEGKNWKSLPPFTLLSSFQGPRNRTLLDSTLNFPGVN